MNITSTKLYDLGIKPKVVAVVEIEDTEERFSMRLTVREGDIVYYEDAENPNKSVSYSQHIFIVKTPYGSVVMFPSAYENFPLLESEVPYLLTPLKCMGE